MVLVEMAIISTFLTLESVTEKIGSLVYRFYNWYYKKEPVKIENENIV